MTVEELQIIVKAKVDGFMAKMQAVTRATEKTSTATKATQKQVDALRHKQALLSEALQKTTAEQKKLLREFNRKMDGTMPITEIKRTETGLAAAEKKAAKLAQTLDSLERDREKAVVQLDFAKGSGNAAAISEAKAAVASIDKQIEPLALEFDETNAKAKTLKKHLAEIKANPQASAEIQALKDRMDGLVQKANRMRSESAALGEQIKSSAVQSGNAIKSASNKSTKATNKAANAVKSFGNRIKGLIKNVLIFSVITSALRAIRTALTSVIKSDSAMSQSLANIKGNLITAFAPIYSYILPGIRAILSALESASARLAYFTSSLFGKSVSQSQQLAKGMYNTAKGAGKAEKSAKKLSKTLLGIDEINAMADNSDTDAGGGGATIEPAFSLGDMSAAQLDEYKAMIKQKLAEIELIVAAASLAIGTILLLTGVKPLLGVALIAVGATALVKAAATDWNGTSDKVKTTLQALTAVIATFVLALGTILLATGVNAPLGVALMCIGAATLATEMALNWNTMSDKTRMVLTALTAVIGGFLLAIGATLCFTGVNVPLGIGLMAAGAVSLGTAAALNWDTIIAKIQNNAVAITAVLSGVALVVGAILCFSGVNVPLGIALMSTGVAGLSIAAAQKWDGAAIVNKIKGVINGIISAVERGVNFIIDKINTISWNVPDWVPGIGGTHFGFNFQRVNIPRLANGGVLPANNPRLAVVGDNRTQREIVTPENAIYEQALRALKTAGGVGSGGNWTFILRRADGHEDSFVLTEAERKNNRDGESLIPLRV